ncbi:MAG: MCP four helix bundle domain-containing protein, partial [Bacteroidia bacterium]
MQWIYSIKPKHKAALILAVVFIMVLGNNILSKRNVTDLGSSFSSVYEDRLLVESYIYKLSDLLYRKKIILDKAISPEALLSQENNLQNHHAQINILLSDYEKTKLTQTETIVFESLKSNIA